MEIPDCGQMAVCNGETAVDGIEPSSISLASLGPAVLATVSVAGRVVVFVLDSVTWRQPLR
ncbi:hypothetical protein GCM10027408_30870 [Microbacterium tumbae]